MLILFLSLEESVYEPIAFLVIIPVQGDSRGLNAWLAEAVAKGPGLSNSRGSVL
jgi:hypothetical protein